MMPSKPGVGVVMSEFEASKEVFLKAMRDYSMALSKEKESLIARYIAATGLNYDQVELVERHTAEGVSFYPRRKETKDLIELAIIYHDACMKNQGFLAATAWEAFHNAVKARRGGGE